jgi:putative hydrolase of HD superfamily
MKKTLKFFLEVNKLKTIQRTGWVLRKVKNPETIADHTFRVAIVSWLLGEKKNLNITRIIKMALFHDLCEVYAGDVTPFFYYLDLPKNEEKRKKKLMKWVRLSKKEKVKRSRKKWKVEEKSLLKLIKPLSPELRKEILASWLDFEKGITKEGKFARPVDKIDTLLQAIEYFGVGEESPVTGWWEEIEELTEDPLVLDFMTVIQNNFYDKKRKSRHDISDEELKKELEGILDFVWEVGKLKHLPRKLWVELGVKNPESVAGHCFTLALMAWIFGREKKGLNTGKLIKMALCHELPSVYTGDLITPYGRILPKTNTEKKKVFIKWPRLSKKEKEKKFLEDYQKEKKALKKLTQKLSFSTKEEIIQLFDEYKTASSAEARFLNQLNVLAVLFQALLYQKEDKNLPVGFLWEWALEKCDNKTCLDFMEELKNKFYGKRFIFKLFDLVNFKKK